MIEEGTSTEASNELCLEKPTKQSSSDFIMITISDDVEGALTWLQSVAD